MTTHSTAPDGVHELDVNSLQQWVTARKMSISEFREITAKTDGDSISVTQEELTRLSETLKVPASLLLEPGSEVPRKRLFAAIARANAGYSRTASRNGVPYYTYHHLVITDAAPFLMPLLIEVLCSDQNRVAMNVHHCEELVVVVRGEVNFHWENDNGPLMQELHTGDSVYIATETPHSFTRRSATAEIIAVNF